MRRPDGYATIISPDHPVLERDTVQCCHCGCVILVKPGTAATVYLLSSITPAGLIHTVEEPGAACWHCQQPVCLPCHARGTCRPLTRTLEQLEQHRGLRV